jgi:hypothetical protein
VTNNQKLSTTMVINQNQVLKTAYENISFILNTLSFDKSIEFYSEILDIEIKNYGTIYIMYRFITLETFPMQ